MSRKHGFLDLIDRRVGVWGIGLEGRTTIMALRSVTADIVMVDDNPGESAQILKTDDGGLEALATCDIVFKTPGIPRRRPDVLALEAQGVYVTSALNYYMVPFFRERTITVTGTKGKSTVTSLSKFFFDVLDVKALAVGNIGRPPYDTTLDTSEGWLVTEMSSFQTVDIEDAPPIIAITSLGSDHLDWHGSQEQYVADKLSITTKPGDHVTIVHDEPSLRAEADQLGGNVIWVSGRHPELTSALGLLGEHNENNVEMALTIVATALQRSVDDIAAEVTPRAGEFTPLPGRLTRVTSGMPEDAVTYIDDGLATSVTPAIAAITLFVDQPLVLLCGGFDRGVDYAPLSDALASRTAPTHVLTLGPAGERIGESLGGRVTREAVATMDEAVARAREVLSGSGVMLFSPAAPSFDRYTNWEERSKDFTRAVSATGQTDDETDEQSGNQSPA